MLKKNLLMHPGFQIDTWSSIEQRYIWLDNPLREYFNVFWLVPPMGSKYSRYTDRNEKDKEPIYVTILKQNKANIIECDITKYNMVKNYLLLKNIFDKYNIDAVFTHFDPLRYSLEIIAKMEGVKVIRGEHNCTFMKRRRFKFIKWFIYKFTTDYYISVSQSVERHLIEKKLQRNNGYVVYNGFDMSFHPESNKELSRRSVIKEFCLPEMSRIISCVAKIDPSKRQHILINMLYNLQKTDLILLLVGAIHNNKYKYELDKLINRLNLNNRVIFCGHHTDVFRLLDASEISYLPSSFEGLGNVVIESYMMCTPVIGSDIPPNREIIDNEYNGYCVNNISEYCHKTLQLLDNSNKRREFGVRGRAKVEKMFSKPVFINETIKALRSAFNYFDNNNFR